MTRIVLSISAVLLLVFFLLGRQVKFVDIKKKGKTETEFKSGDIIFQTNTAGQGRAVMLATKSKYTHVGMIFYEGSQPYVYEAVQPVKKTPLSVWITNGEGSHYVVKRLINADSILTENVLEKIKINFYTFNNKNYDLYFGWDDQKLYCSELVWKLYKNCTGLAVGKLSHLKDFDLSSLEVKSILANRFGKNIPYNEIVISPQAIFDSELIYTVDSH